MRRMEKESYLPMEGSEIANLVDETEMPERVRTVQRRAAVALVVSVCAFLAALGVVAAVFVRPARGPVPVKEAEDTRLFEAPAVQDRAPAPFASLEDSKKSLAMLADAFKGIDAGGSMVPMRYSLVAPTVLRSDLGLSSPAVRELTSGTRLFPLRHRMGWIMVLLANDPEEPRDQRSARFGWIPAEQDGAELLEKDAVPPKPDLSERKVSMSEVSKRWADVRSENAKLKESLSSLKDSMHKHMMDKLHQKPHDSAVPSQVPAAAETQDAPKAVAASSTEGPASNTAVPAAAASLNLKELSTAAKGAVNVQEVKKDVTVLEKDVQHELKGKQLVNDIGSLFR